MIILKRDFKMKTIGIVINTSWNIYNFRLGLLAALQKEGYKVIAVAPNDEYSQKFCELDIDYHEISMNNKGTNPIEDAKLIYSYYKLYKKIKPDILLHYTIKPNIYGSIAAKMLNIPVINNISGLGTVFLNPGLSSGVAKMLYKATLKIPEKVFFQNSHDRELFVDLNYVNKGKTDLLPGSGIDTEKFKPSEKAVSTKEEHLKFLFIARLVKDKGLVEYVEAIKLLRAKYKNAEFAILGAFYPGNPTAITEEDMDSWVEEDLVNYLGTSDDVKSVIDNYDCVVLPSYREGLSRVLLEASSMGKPIVTTNVPGCKEVVDDGITGFLCNAKDASDLAAKMEQMLQLSHEERIDMGMKGRDKIINEFDEKLVIRKYIEAIESI